MVVNFCSYMFISFYVAFDYVATLKYLLLIAILNWIIDYAPLNIVEEYSQLVQKKSFLHEVWSLVLLL